MQKSYYFLIASITPAILFLFLVYRKDKQKEPWNLLLGLFIGGFGGGILSALLIWGLEAMGFSLWQGLSFVFFVTLLLTSFFQEAVKWLLSRKFVWNNPEFDEPFDAIVYSVFTSMGFALVCNLFFLLGFGNFPWLYVVFMVPVHLYTGVTMGVYFSKARWGRPLTRRFNFWFSLLAPFLFNALSSFVIIIPDQSLFNNIWYLTGTIVIYTLFVIFIWMKSVRLSSRTMGYWRFSGEINEEAEDQP